MMSRETYWRLFRGMYLRRALAFVITLVIGLLFAQHAYAIGPANNHYTDREIIGPSLPIDVSGSTVGADADGGEPSHPGGSAQSSIWYQWTAPASQWVRLDTCESEHPTLGAVYTGTQLANLSLVADTSDAVCKVQFQAVAGTPYKIVLEGFGNPGVTHLHIRAAFQPFNDDFADRLAIAPNVPVAVNGNNVDATKEPGEPSNPSSSVWYEWVAPGTGEATIDTCASAFDTTLEVFAGSALGNLVELAGNDDTAGCGAAGTGSLVTVDVAAGSAYEIAVDSATVEEGAFTLRIDGQLVAPGAAAPQSTPAPAPAPAATTAKKKCKKGRVRRHGKCVKKRRHS